ncbi:MAG: hypothetical protein CMH57_10430 [Myxococcales bacterium]|nr:hypothetical protein [Myxococcales bacterium]
MHFLSMDRPHLTSTFALLTLLTSLNAAGCGTTPTRVPPLSARVGQALDDGWSIDLSREGYEGWSVYAPEGPCVVVTARTTSAHAEATRPRRSFACYDPLSGEPRWSYEHPVSEGFTWERVLFTPERLIYVRPDLAFGVSLSSGKLIWELDDQIGREFQRSAALFDDLLILDLAHEVLVVLDANQGTWVRGVSLGGGQLQVVLPGPAGPLAVMTRVAELFEEGETHLLEGFNVLGPGGEQPAPPRAEPNPLWSVEISDGDHKLHVVGDTLVGFLGEGHLHVLDPSDGETLHDLDLEQKFRLVAGGVGKAPASAPATSTTPLTPTQILQNARRPDPPELGNLKNGRLELQGAPRWILTQGPRQGIAMTLVEVNAYDPRTLERRWRATLPWSATSRQQTRRSELDALFLANPQQAALLDAATGQVLWSDDLNAEDGPWLGIDTNGAALYTLHQEDTVVRLRARPLSHRAGDHP